MSEPTNPLFEDEKDFLERKKLEYERALRGDVEHIKEQTVHVGKLAAIGAGVVGGIWLLSKAFGGKKKKKHKEWHYRDDDDADYSFGGDDYGAAYADDQPWDSSRYFDEEPHGYADNDEETAADVSDVDLEDNGLSEFPDFEPYSGSHHGYTPPTDYYQAPAGADHPDVYHTDAPNAAPADSRRFYSEDHSHPTANAGSLPYDDSRRLPKSDSFADLTQAEEVSQAAPKTRNSWFGPAVRAFLQSETGRVITGQVAAVALAAATKVVQDLLPKQDDEEETPKTSDLAPSKAAGAYPYGQHPAPAAPQSPVLDAHDPDADASTTAPPLA